MYDFLLYLYRLFYIFYNLNRFIHVLNNRTLNLFDHLLYNWDLFFDIFDFNIPFFFDWIFQSFWALMKSIRKIHLNTEFLLRNQSDLDRFWLLVTPPLNNWINTLLHWRNGINLNASLLFITRKRIYLWTVNTLPFWNNIFPLLVFTFLKGNMRLPFDFFYFFSFENIRSSSPCCARIYEIAPSEWWIILFSLLLSTTLYLLKRSNECSLRDRYCFTNFLFKWHLIDIYIMVFYSVPL